ncbi:MAG: hypothetical protein M3154_05990 [Candidatus Eremiobacteraeota bacterium]|nr:hypothetical protein [Candidatus Eremiobacteraeota bacterium]
MFTRSTFVAALVLAPAAVHAQVDSTARDSALATLLSRDGATRLVLTARALRFGFTEQGARRVRCSVDSSVAAQPASGWLDVAALAHTVSASVVGGMRLAFPLRDVREVRVSGDSLTVCLASQPVDADPCSARHRLTFSGAAPADVQRFAGAVDRARAAR